MEKVLGSFITDYINYTLAKSQVHNMYIEGEVDLANRPKNRVFSHRPKNFRLTKKM